MNLLEHGRLEPPPEEGHVGARSPSRWPRLRTRITGSRRSTPTRCWTGSRPDPAIEEAAQGSDPGLPALPGAAGLSVALARANPSYDDATERSIAASRRGSVRNSEMMRESRRSRDRGAAVWTCNVDDYQRVPGFTVYAAETGMTVPRRSLSTDGIEPARMEGSGRNLARTGGRSPGAIRYPPRRGGARSWRRWRRRGR